jgi:hypothetical protein
MESSSTPCRKGRSPGHAEPDPPPAPADGWSIWSRKVWPRGPATCYALLATWESVEEDEMGCKKDKKAANKEAQPGDYRCQKCAAVSSKKKHICKPRKIKK